MFQSKILIVLNIRAQRNNSFCFVTLLPILILVKGESGSLYTHRVPVLASQVEVCSDTQALFTCTGLVSCASASSVLLNSWAHV